MEAHFFFFKTVLMTNQHVSTTVFNPFLPPIINIKIIFQPTQTF